MITPTEGASFDLVVGSFTDANNGAPASDFTATVDWGDGSGLSVASAIVSTGGGGFDVRAGHAYASYGTFRITIVVNDEGGSTVTVDSRARVPILAPAISIPMLLALVALLSLIGLYTLPRRWRP